MASYLPNIPLPTKIVTRILEPIDVARSSVKTRTSPRLMLTCVGLCRMRSTAWPRAQIPDSGVNLASIGRRNDDGNFTFRHGTARTVDRSHATGQVSPHGRGHVARKISVRLTLLLQRPSVVRTGRHSLTTVACSPGGNLTSAAMHLPPRYRLSRGSAESDRHNVPQPPGIRGGVGRVPSIGADVLLLNTSFAAPALLEILDREGAGRHRL